MHSTSNSSNIHKLQIITLMWKIIIVFSVFLAKNSSRRKYPDKWYRKKTAQVQKYDSAIEKSLSSQPASILWTGLRRHKLYHLWYLSSSFWPSCCNPVRYQISSKLNHSAMKKNSIFGNLSPVLVPAKGNH